MRSTVVSRRPSAGLVVAIVALFVALGGTSYAAVKISGFNIKKNSIPANRVMNNALGGKQIDEAKLGAVPLAASATTANSAATATSAQDALALQGRDASKFLANSVRLVLNQSVAIATGNGTSITATCEANEKAIGGGGAWIISANNPTELNAPITASMPVPPTAGTDNMTGWRVSGLNQTGANRFLRAYVVCVPKTA